MKSATLFLIASSVALLHSAEPEKLGKLRSSYEAAVARATDPLRKSYLSELEKLKAEFTRKAQLEDALAVDAVIKSLARQAAAPSPPSPPSGAMSAAPSVPKANGVKLSMAEKKVLETIIVGSTWQSTKWKEITFSFAKGGKGTRMMAGKPDFIEWEIQDDGTVTSTGGGPARVFWFTTPTEGRFTQSGNESEMVKTN